ncbi:MAG: DUF4160 domain-containing protein [Chloroflexi bacterium]|nr:DUF4160 domain-containing protein [Chloroflexota bacterium]
MSPTRLHRNAYGYDVRLYTKDRPPAHVHVFDGENEAKVGLDPIQIVDNWGFTERELKQITQLIEQMMLLSEWDKYHPIW